MREILSEQTLYEQGSFKRVKRYVSGWHPKEGKLLHGFSGKETVEEKTIVKPLKTIYVKPIECINEIFDDGDYISYSIPVRRP